MDFDIAVIGMDCKFPGANHPDEFWRLLTSDVSAIVNISSLSDVTDLNTPHYIPYKGIINQPFHFDADFFGISPAEAKLIDPQHRHFFQTSYRAFESAGYNPRKINNTTGVFASCGFPGYLFHHLMQNGKVMREYDSLSLQLANDKDFIATKLSYLLNLKGPSISVQTACSGSLMAVHLACRSLIFGECDMALAGGASLSYPLYRGHYYREGSISSKDGCIYAFDKRATGTVRGDGVGVVILKRLKDAESDLDPIIAVIKGSAVNNDGRNKVSFTAPGVPGQSDVIRSALKIANLSTDDPDLIETHGTGTKIGDPIEVRAIHEVFKNRNNPVVLSSVKPHIGHLDAASGIAGLIKLCLAIRERTLPHTLNFTDFNPLIDPYKDCIRIPKACEPWNSSSGYTAGITSLGMGGTNVHMILQGYPKSREMLHSRPIHSFSGEEHVIYPDSKGTQNSFADKPLTIETQIKDSWIKVLGCSAISPEDNFFELGGDSFLAIQCLSKLPERLKDRIGVIDFFQYPALNEFIEHSKSIIGE